MTSLDHGHGPISLILSSSIDTITTRSSIAVSANQAQGREPALSSTEPSVFLKKNSNRVAKLAAKRSVRKEQADILPTIKRDKYFVGILDITFINFI
tara:strand:+ start:1622 stop:1912 length:291 start_codon:yes stop_codon:yes gene_type:complete